MDVLLSVYVAYLLSTICQEYKWFEPLLYLSSSSLMFSNPFVVVQEMRCVSPPDKSLKMEGVRGSPFTY